jgi:predicted nucleic acid-binding protein
LRTPLAAAVEAELRRVPFDLHVPAVCDVEVASVLRRALLARRLTAERAAAALDDYLDLPLSRHHHAASLPRMLALRDNFSAYDATYVALAERLDAILVTGDAPLARAVRAHLDLEVVGVS